MSFFVDFHAFHNELLSERRDVAPIPVAEMFLTELGEGQSLRQATVSVPQCNVPLPPRLSGHPLDRPVSTRRIPTVPAVEVPNLVEDQFDGERREMAMLAMPEMLGGQAGEARTFREPIIAFS